MGSELTRQRSRAKSWRVTALSSDGGDFAHQVAKLRERRQGRASDAARAATGELAWSVAGETMLTPEAVFHPQLPRILAHEAVHRTQFARLGDRPVATRLQLEAEAVAGAETLLAGDSFTPSPLQLFVLA